MKPQEEKELLRRLDQEMLLAGLSKNTRYNYSYHCRNLWRFSNKLPNEMTDEDLREYFCREEEMNKDNQTRQVHVCAVRFLYKKMYGAVPKVLQGIHIKAGRKNREIMTLNQIHALLKHVKQEHFRLLFRLIYVCGLRISEALNIKAQDISKERALLLVHGKGSKEREVPLPEEMYQELRAYWAKYRPPKPWIFSNPKTGRPYLSSTAQHTFSKARKTLGMSKKITVHTLRHSYATCQLENRIDLKTIQLAMGHAYLSTTCHYLHLTERLKQNSREVMSEQMRKMKEM